MGTEKGTRMSEELPTLFPGLGTTPFRVTSPADGGYNCIAWAGNDAGSVWWPAGEGPGIFWPPEAPREETLDAFVAAFAMLGYVPGANDSLEAAVEKIAVFINAAQVPTHAARQLPSGRWTSKLGKLEDIEHDLRALEGDIYGTVAVVLKRPTPPSG